MSASNAARKLQPEPPLHQNRRKKPSVKQHQPPHKPERHRNPQKTRTPQKANYTRKASKSKAAKYVYFDTMNNRISFPIIFTVVLIFALGVGTAFSSAFLQDMRNQIERQRNALHQQQDNNVAMRATVARNLPLYEVERIARERLHMGIPDESQKVFIDVSRQSYVVQSNEPRPQQSQGMWQSALQYIRNWLGV